MQARSLPLLALLALAPPLVGASAASASKPMRVDVRPGSTQAVQSAGLRSGGTVQLKARAATCAKGARLTVRLADGAATVRHLRDGRYATYRARVVRRAVDRALPATDGGAKLRVERGGRRCLVRVAGVAPVGVRPLRGVAKAPAPTPTASTATPAPAPPARPVLQPEPRTAPVVLGAAAGAGMLFGADPRFAQTLSANFGSLTPENEMKMDTTQPTPTTWNFGDADRIVDFAQQHGMRVRGHTLVWHNQLPDWLKQGTFTRDQLIQILQDRVRTMVSRYKGRVQEWDVVNEPLTDGTPSGLRHSVWYDGIGPDYIAIALRAAHDADPDAKLFINEYADDLPGAKTDALVQLAGTLKAQGVPLDGIGMQMHLAADYPGLAGDVQSTMRRYASLGLQVEVTELDVESAAMPGSPADRAARQASIYGQVSDACRSTTACTGITTWGLTDASTWLGTDQAPLPFTTDYQPKPAWSALVGG